MATLEKIRSKGGILVGIFVGLALLAFIMMDFMSSGASIFTGNQMEVANINGTSVNIQDFQNKVSEMEEFNKINTGGSAMSEDEAYRLREQVWNQLISQTLLEEQYEQIGIAVSSDELMDMVTGRNIHPAISQHPLFANQQTGVFDRQAVVSFLQNKSQDPTAYFYWMVMEEQLLNEKLFNKYSTLLKKGLYVPKAWKDSEIAARSKSVDFDYITVRFTSVADSLVSVSETEINAYYKKNGDDFKQSASRNIEYITFDIVPTEADRMAAQDWINELIPNFSSAETDPIQYVNLNSDVPYNGRNQRAAELSSQLESFVTSAQVGEVYGPYLENEAYKASRLVAINNIPDSVRARHILVREATSEATNSLADSLLNLARRGADFADLARRYSLDQGSAINGGDLGWFPEGVMVKPFNDAVFYGKTGDIVKAESQFGVHIIHIQQQGVLSPKYQLATLVREINYSSETYQNVFSKATRFAADNNNVELFNKAVEENNITKRYGRAIGENDNSVSGLSSSRELVRWAYEAKVGDLSPVYEFDDRFVIANLVSVSEEGVRALSEVRPQIERTLIADKKAELLTAQLAEISASGADFPTIASKMNTSVQSAENINFASFQVPGAGVEPALVAAAVYTPAGQISKAVRGNNGVYLVKVNNVEANEVMADNIEVELEQNASMKIDYEMLQSLRDNAEIVDGRSKFY